MKTSKISKKLTALIVICMIGLCVSCSNYSGDRDNAKYHVVVTNGWVEGNFYCDNYKQEDDVFILLDKDGEFIAEIHRPEKYLIAIEKNPDKKY